MKWLLVFALVFSVGHAPAALAGETLLSSATRLAREAVRHEASSQPKANARTFASAEQGASGLASSGLSRHSKIMIAVVAAAGFALTAYTIDHKVLDNTPSSLGTRKD